MKVKIGDTVTVDGQDLFVQLIAISDLELPAFDNQPEHAELFCSDYTDLHKIEIDQFTHINKEPVPYTMALGDRYDS